MEQKIQETQLNLSQNDHKIGQNRTLPTVYKTRQYGLLKKMIKEGKFTSVRMTARAIGVRPETIQSWLSSPSIMKLVAEEMNSYVSDIKQSKDWKAKAYLIDRLIEHNKKDEESSNLQIVVVQNKQEVSVRMTENQ